MKRAAQQSPNPRLQRATGGQFINVACDYYGKFLVSASLPVDLGVSSDLDQWSPVTIVTNLTGTLEFTDPDAANLRQRFYRTVGR